MVSGAFQGFSGGFQEDFRSFLGCFRGFKQIFWGTLGVLKDFNNLTTVLGFHRSFKFSRISQGVAETCQRFTRGFVVLQRVQKRFRRFQRCFSDFSGNLNTFGSVSGDSKIRISGVFWGVPEKFHEDFREFQGLGLREFQGLDLVTFQGFSEGFKDVFVDSGGFKGL